MQTPKPPPGSTSSAAPLMTLEQVSEALAAQLKDATQFTCVNTRVILQTGVNLKEVTRAQNTNPELVKKVCQTLLAMGFDLKQRGAP